MCLRYESRRLELHHGRGEIATTAIRNPFEHSNRDLTTDHRHRLHERLLLARKAIQARGDDRLNAGGQNELVGSADQPVFARRAAEMSDLCECPDDLLDEERIAGRTIADLFREPVE